MDKLLTRCRPKEQNKPAQKSHCQIVLANSFPYINKEIYMSSKTFKQVILSAHSMHLHLLVSELHNNIRIINKDSEFILKPKYSIGGFE